jgi:hypothetical protein
MRSSLPRSFHSYRAANLGDRLRQSWIVLYSLQPGSRAHPLQSIQFGPCFFQSLRSQAQRHTASGQDFLHSIETDTGQRRGPGNGESLHAIAVHGNDNSDIGTFLPQDTQGFLDGSLDIWIHACLYQCLHVNGHRFPPQLPVLTGTSSNSPIDYSSGVYCWQLAIPSECSSDRQDRIQHEGQVIRQFE